MGTQVLSSIELDTAFNCGEDGDWLREICQMAAEYDVHEVRVVDPHGPGGGWPIIEYSGRTADLARMIKAEFDPGDEESVEELLAIMYRNATPLT